MNDREKLIEIVRNSLKKNIGKSCKLAENIVDDIIGAGVIVPPVKVEERRIDDLGRIHIPKNVRLSLGINYGDVISISVSDESIILRKEREDNA